MYRLFQIINDVGWLKAAGMQIRCTRSFSRPERHLPNIEMLCEPHRDKTNKMACAPSEDSYQPGHPPSLISLRCPHEEILGP